MSLYVLIASLLMSEVILTERDLVFKVLKILRAVEAATQPQSLKHCIPKEPFRKLSFAEMIFRKLSLTEMIFRLLETITVLKNNPHLFSVSDRECVRLLFNHLLWERACRKPCQSRDQPIDLLELSPGVFVRVGQVSHDVPELATLEYVK